MKKTETPQTEDMTQVLEIINAKGDMGELQEIAHYGEKMTCNDELFYKELRTIVEDGARDDD
ncbi:hypothetical protein [Priestia abyssalis]|uniref:hypothetical protein n=1 Tax=Priestia abyssalis TaxID=1221450 RepID=UPI000994C534|nr:hypothetical protein [Priestia abyssalis]